MDLYGYHSFCVHVDLIYLEIQSLVVLIVLSSRLAACGKMEKKHANAPERRRIDSLQNREIAHPFTRKGYSCSYTLHTHLHTYTNIHTHTPEVEDGRKQL